MTFASPLLLRLATVAVVGCATVSLAGCGRKGDPEVPTVDRPAAARPLGIPVGPTPESKPPPTQKRSFVLDPLL